MCCEAIFATPHEKHFIPDSGILRMQLNFNPETSDRKIGTRRGCGVLWELVEASGWQLRRVQVPDSLSTTSRPCGYIRVLQVDGSAGVYKSHAGFCFFAFDLEARAMPHIEAQGPEGRLTICRPRYLQISF